MRGASGAERTLTPMRIVMAALLAIVLAACGAAAVTPAPTEFEAPPAPPAPAGMPQVAISDLPEEAIHVLDLIEQGGPFAHDQDGSIFQNREERLPDRPRGHYREYTVETPGSDDRGARRIVAGADGERYWTDDHYDSFRWIAE